MILAVTGGKGGTGKTTIALSLALRDPPDRFLDADVTTPNAALLLGVETRVVDVVTKGVPRILPEKCKRCALCAKRCPTGAIVAVEGKLPVVVEELCVGCGLCAKYCPFGAIVMEAQRIGEIRKGTGPFNVFEGVADPGVTETSIVVRRLMEYAKGDVIVDTAAGLHCDVIHALLPADAVLVVAEPTPYSLHDAKKVLELLDKMGKRAYVVLNKAGMSEKYERMIEGLAEEKSVEILARIPFDKKAFRSPRFTPLEVDVEWRSL